MADRATQSSGSAIYRPLLLLHAAHNSKALLRWAEDRGLTGVATVDAATVIRFTEAWAKLDSLSALETSTALVSSAEGLDEHETLDWISDHTEDQDRLYVCSDVKVEHGVTPGMVSVAEEVERRALVRALLRETGTLQAFSNDGLRSIAVEEAEFLSRPAYDADCRDRVP